MEHLGLCLVLEQLYTDWVFQLDKSIIFHKQNNSEARLPFERRELESTAFCEWTLKAARIEANVMQISRHVLRLMLMSLLKHHWKYLGCQIESETYSKL